MRPGPPKRSRKRISPAPNPPLISSSIETRPTPFTEKEENFRVSRVSWEQWIAIDGFKRTCYCIYCVFSQLCMTFDIPTNITNADPRLSLRCSGPEWRASDSSRGISCIIQPMRLRHCLSKTLCATYSPLPHHQRRKRLLVFVIRILDFLLRLMRYACHYGLD